MEKLNKVCLVQFRTMNRTTETKLYFWSTKFTILREIPRAKNKMHYNIDIETSVSEIKRVLDTSYLIRINFRFSLFTTNSLAKTQIRLSYIYPTIKTTCDKFFFFTISPFTYICDHEINVVFAGVRYLYQVDYSHRLEK